MVHNFQMAPRKTLPPYLQRSLLALIIVLMGISVARLLVTMHQQDERISIIEGQLAQLMADTARLQIPVYVSTPYPKHEAHHDYHRTTSSRSSYGPRPATNGRHPAQNDTTVITPLAADGQTVKADAPTRRKFTEPHQFDLNTVDSATLVRIPGIAERTASTILQHRQRYGGFYSPRQLQEFLTWDAAQAYMEEWCTLWFTADASRIRPIDINAASVSEMQRHPYITHEQAIELIRYRTRHKRFSSAVELQQLSSFTPQQIEQLLPYLSFQ